MNINCYFIFCAQSLKKKILFLIYTLNKVILDQNKFVVIFLEKILIAPAPHRSRKNSV